MLLHFGTSACHVLHMHMFCTRFLHMKRLFGCFMYLVTRTHGPNEQEIGVFNTKQVSYVRMRPRGRVTLCDKTRASMVGRRHNCPLLLRLAQNLIKISQMDQKQHKTVKLNMLLAQKCSIKTRTKCVAYACHVSCMAQVAVQNMCMCKT